ncbi:hypothetical protein GCM10009116_26360 [Brevundimonas basaltis]|uniref:Uncharacterized protein n=1 Tax=Brevundimonas basaltis TaxID=472166 RepID=A0A7W8HXC9_9CAUL|nr:hypothetical protein [Brevundimonas basaltis]MBB5291651.1 hypothetical protein [Brevundimonas basaltis]
MVRTLAPAFAGLTLALVAGAAAAQTWGQPVYVSPWGRVVGGTPLSEIETRSYVNTGRWADGYSDQAYVYVPAPVYGAHYSYGYGYGHDHRYGYGYGYDRGRYGHGRYERRPYQGYRDEWGYNDDRHPSARGYDRDRRYRRDHRYHDRDCGCPDVYLYDR